MRLTEFLITESVSNLKDELSRLNKELVSAKSGGNDAVVEQLRNDIKHVKEKIKDAQS